MALTIDFASRPVRPERPWGKEDVSAQFLADGHILPARNARGPQEAYEGRAFVVMIVTRLMARFFSSGAHGARWYPWAFAGYYRLVLSQPVAAAQRQRIGAAATEAAPLLAQAWRSFGTPDNDVRALAPRLTCPVLFTWAMGDWINRLKRCRPAIQRFPNARVETFRGGHAAFLEDPDAFVAALERFLSTVRFAESGTVHAAASRPVEVSARGA